VLSTEEYVNALVSFLELQAELPILRLDLFKDMRNMLLDRDRSTTCLWNACDPHTTRAVRGGEGDCRFFLMCKGQFPGTSISGDWRNRIEHCEL